jgi:hypothetical protein
MAAVAAWHRSASFSTTEKIFTKGFDMNCSICNTPLDHDMQFCLKCGTKVGSGTGQNNPSVPPVIVPKKSGMSTGCIIALVIGAVFSIPVLGIFAAILLPAISSARLQANAASVASKGREICVGIMSASMEREPFGEASVWPKTAVATGSVGQKKDALSKVFKTSTDYFNALADEENYGKDKWSPYISGFDYTRLAGAGVPPSKDRHLTADNNMWAIAANLTDADNDLIPVLITRNVDVKAIERVVNQGLSARDFNTRINVGNGEYVTPFGNQMVVVIRKGGSYFMLRSRQATLGNLFGNHEFPPRDPSKPPIVYLMP